MEWYCRLLSTGQTIGPVTGRDLKSLAERRQIGPRDMVAQSLEGPWYPAAQIRGLFADVVASPAETTANRPMSTGGPAIGVSPPTTTPPHVAAIPIPVGQGTAAESDSERSAALGEIRRRKLFRKRHQKKLIGGLLIAFVAANAVLLVVLWWPRGGASPDVPPARQPTIGDQATQKLKPLDTADLDTLLPESVVKASARATQPSALADTAAAFGTALSKLSDQNGNVRIVIEKVERGYPQLLQGTVRAWPAQPLLIMTLAISNSETGDAIDYRGWKTVPELAYLSLSPTGPSIARLRTFTAGVEVVGSAKPTRLAPGDSVHDLLLFPLPDEQAETFYCTLIGDPVGAKGARFQFIIPASSIVDLPVPPEIAKRKGIGLDNTAVADQEGDGLGPPDASSESESPPQ